MGELTSATSKERMIMNINFAVCGKVHMPVSLYLRMLDPLLSFIDKGEHEKYLLPLYENLEIHS